MLLRFDQAALLLVVSALKGSCSDPLFQPTILSPNSTDVWDVGDVRTVSWSNHDLDIPPSQHGEILLGYNEPSTNTSTAYYQQPLAQGFLISDQVVNVVVPAVPSGDFYFIVLNGDANAQTGLFAIVNPASPAGPSSANVTLPATISISSAPPATTASATASTPSSSSAPNGVQPRVAGDGWRWFAAVAIMVVATGFNV